MARQYFKAIGNKNITDVKTLLHKGGWQLERVANNSRKFVVLNKSESRVFNWVKPVHTLYDDIEKHGIEKFIGSFTKVMKNGEAVGATKEPKTKGRKKKVSERSKVVVELSDKITETTLKLMHFSVVRGSDEHKELREELRGYRAQLSDLGIDRRTMLMNRKGGDLTPDAMAAARERGEAMKKERKIKKEKKQNRNATLKNKGKNNGKE